MKQITYINAIALSVKFTRDSWRTEVCQRMLGRLDAIEALAGVDEEINSAELKEIREQLYPIRREIYDHLNGNFKGESTWKSL